jgi:hypothetical protein
MGLKVAVVLAAGNNNVDIQVLALRRGKACCILELVDG